MKEIETNNYKIYYNSNLQDGNVEFLLQDYRVTLLFRNSKSHYNDYEVMVL
jgi:hypothetical protein